MKKDDLKQVLDANMDAFRERFGREPRDDDPILFDTDEPGPDPVPFHPVKISDQMLVAMVAAGMPHPLVWGFLLTGRIMDKEGLQSLSRTDRAEWQNALRVTSSIEPFVEAARERLRWNCYPGRTHFPEPREVA